MLGIPGQMSSLARLSCCEIKTSYIGKSNTSIVIKLQTLLELFF